MTERDNVLAVATALRAIATEGSAGIGKVLVERSRLLTLASTIERSLAVNVFEQPPSLREWRAMVMRTPEWKEHPIDLDKKDGPP